MVNFVQVSFAEVKLVTTLKLETGGVVTALAERLMLSTKSDAVRAAKIDLNKRLGNIRPFSPSVTHTT